jgi:signal transduction histidine kinase
MVERLCPVVERFGAAVEACLDHQLVVEENEHRRRAVSRALREERTASIGALAGGVAARFGRALTEILARSASLRDHESARGEHVDAIAASAAAAQQLCRQLSQLSGPRAADGEGLGAGAPRDLDGVVTQALHIAERRIPGGVRVVSERHGAPPAVRCDADDLRSAFATLMSRAIAASARRGGVVTVRILPEHVRQQDFVHYPFGTLRRAGDYACVEIEDLGDGMDEAAKAALFEPVVASGAEETGLEMAAALGVIRRHRGAVAVESAPRAGTCVRVLLPAASQPRVGHAHERALER